MRNKDIKKDNQGDIYYETWPRVLRGGLLVQDVWVVCRVMRVLLFSPAAPWGHGCGKALQSVLENSACERLRTNTVWVRPSGQSKSLQGFLVAELGLEMEAKGRSGREVGKCGLVWVGGTEGLEAPMARGEETGGREYIMTGLWNGWTCY